MHLDPKNILSKYWGYEDFRPMQQEIITSLMLGNDVLALLPTGGGKSLCFQIPILCIPDKVALVVSPLIALMKDQVYQLKQRNISAAAIYSGMSRREIDIIIENTRLAKNKLLYVSPERLQSDHFIERLKYANVAYIAVDEAHCISQWGHDFRPSYLNISEIRTYWPDAPIIAVTATANDAVAKDITEYLSLKNPDNHAQSFSRDNLSLSVIYSENKLKHVLRILINVDGTGIIYVRSRRATVEICESLRKREIKAIYYHAGLTAKEREDNQLAWQKNRCRVIVCTSAFGMGIDKSDVRFVIHLDLPPSIEEYYQEVGRGGRDGKKAFGIFIYNQEDINQARKKVASSFVEIPEIYQIYAKVCQFFGLATGAGLGEEFSFDVQEFQRLTDIPLRKIFRALKVLQENEWLQLSEYESAGSKIQVLKGKQSYYNKFKSDSIESNILKGLLRNFEGIFSAELTFDVFRFANKLDRPYKEVHASLLKLDKIGFIKYQVRDKNPRIRFLRARVRTEDLYINTSKYNRLKKLVEDRQASLINLLDFEGCRQDYILRYFDEKNIEPCGLCDNCLGMGKESFSEKQLIEMKARLKEKWAEGQSYEAIVDQFPTNKRRRIKNLLREMIDLGMLKRNHK